MEPMEETIVIEDHMKLTFGIMNDLRKRKELCDVILCVEGQEIYAHRVVLASFSPYFYAMFTNDVIESRQDSVTLKSMDSKSVQLLIEFAYTSQIRITEENVQYLLPVACILQISAVKKACCDFLQSQLDPSNCIGIKDFTEIYGCVDLAKAAEKFIFRHFLEVSQSEEFENLTREQLTDFIRRDELYVKSEDEVLGAMLRWVTHDLQNRTQELKQLLDFIRVPFVSNSYLKSLMQCCEQGLRSEFKDMLIQAFSGTKRVSTSTTVQKRRPPGPTVVFFAGGYLRRSLDVVECYDPLTLTWSILPPLAVPKSGLGAAYVDSMLYIIGGRNNTSSGNIDSASVDRYDPLRDDWRSMKPLSVPRNRLGVAVSEGYIYAIGGGNGNSCHTSVERYDPNQDEWTRVTPLNFCRIGVAVAVLGKRLYAIGGFDGGNRLRSVECHDVDADLWTLVSPLAERRSGAGAASLHGYIYAIGGYNGDAQLNSVERYDPSSDTWTVMSPLVHRRSALSATVYCDRLFVLGGYDGEGFLNTIEEYIVEKDCWRLVSTMNLGRSGAGVAVGWKPAT
ncbi:kelch-like ECH-associated protein 1 [Montipora capricornis]|uniref:kelch-like ECH-associated protein 1 n=1 Tax=Montipora capricornis TaxID=246305 RepID=UPI0035F1156E